MKDGKDVTRDLIKESFPNISISGDVGNPCDDDCAFEIVSSSEQMTNEETLRPHDSNEHPIDREKYKQKVQTVFYGFPYTFKGYHNIVVSGLVCSCVCSWTVLYPTV